MATKTSTLTEGPREAVSWTQPSHPDVLKVSDGAGGGSFMTHAVSMKDFPAGAVIAKMDAATPATRRSYATVQASKTGDIDLNSDLVYCNHSCDPNLVFDMKKMEARVGDKAGLKKGDDFTFFYPSTEWDMQQPFQCTCGSDQCIGLIRGAKWMSKEQLQRYWLNEHIEELLSEQDAGKQ
jgi:hypothetical protein